MMTFLETAAVVAIVILFLNMRNNRRRGNDAMRGGYNQVGETQPSPRETELEREVIALRKRLEVLERITTDANSSDRLRSQQVADEIESLRDR